MGQFVTENNLVTVVILNWEKYNARNDREINSWFRFQSNFFDNMERLEKACHFDVILMLFLLCACSKVNKNYVLISCRLTCAMLKVTEDELLKSLKFLESIEFVKSTLSVPLTDLLNLYSGGLQNKTKQNNTTGVFDFTLIYESYPRKHGKSEGLSRLEKQITSQEDFDLFKLAVSNYADYCKTNKVETKFIKQFSSFVGTQKVQPWRDYLEYTQTKKVTVMRKLGVENV